MKSKGKLNTTRRDFLKMGAMAGGGLLLPWVSKGAIPAGTIDPATLPKFVETFHPGSLGAMPFTSTGTKNYQLAIRQFKQQILPAGYPATTVAGYGSLLDPSSFHTPARPIVTAVSDDVYVTWVNQLVAANGNFLPHVLASELKPSAEWANPPGPRDTVGSLKGTYNGPVPLVAHLHGGEGSPTANDYEASDGHPMAWFLPAANNIPAGYATSGTYFDQFKAEFYAKYGIAWAQGAATYRYNAGYNDVATLLWAHDHTMGLTEFNVYAGFAGGYLVTGGGYDLPSGVLPPSIPLVIQDRTFKLDGSLYFGNGDGNVKIVNGVSYPYLNVEPRRYRFRILNGQNNEPLEDLQLNPNVPAYVIGGDIGFLPKATPMSHVFLDNAERLDVIVDFSRIPVGNKVYLQDGSQAIMQFRVVALTSPDNTTPVSQLGTLPVKVANQTLGAVRKVAALDSLIGVFGAGGTPVALMFDDPATETPTSGKDEIWEVYAYNDHPMHAHVGHVEIINRQKFTSATTTPPKPWETGTKDTFAVRPGEITRVRMHFRTGRGNFVWHCHTLSHEDAGMMRPLKVV
jgi:spore coat protein A, manganese oxidase